MKVIFLDIDGVLNVISQGHDKYGAIFHYHLVENLEKIIIQTSAKIVITSTWRASGLKQMQSMWKDRKLPGEVIGITPHSRDRHRGKEIEYYINHTDIDRFVIIDDDNDMLKAQRKYFVKTSGNLSHPDCIDIGYGLTKICAEKAIEILNR
jgi:hypothetical protein